MGTSLRAYLQLCRPANLPTAAADILAGMVLAGWYVYYPISDYVPEAFFGILASVLLYAGGVVLNDVFDAELDRVERPERPIPSGRVSLRNARIFGTALLGLGICSAVLANLFCGTIALLLAAAIGLYDARAKKHAFFGPAVMGLCRALNLLMGMAVFGDLTNGNYALIPMIFIGAITLISRGEVHGKNKGHLVLSGLFYAVVLILVFVFHGVNNADWMQVIPFAVLFALMVFIPLIRAHKENSPQNIKKAVVAGVMSVVVLDALIAVGLSDWMMGFGILLLFPLSLLLSRLFAVT